MSDLIFTVDEIFKDALDHYEFLVRAWREDTLVAELMFVDDRMAYDRCKFTCTKGYENVIKKEARKWFRAEKQFIALPNHRKHLRYDPETDEPHMTPRGKLLAENFYEEAIQKIDEYQRENRIDNQIFCKAVKITPSKWAKARLGVGKRLPLADLFSLLDKIGYQVNLTITKR